MLSFSLRLINTSRPAKNSSCLCANKLLNKSTIRDEGLGEIVLPSCLTK